MRKLPIILAGAYAALLVLGMIPIFTGDGPLSGIFAVVLSAPWSMWLGRLFGVSGESLAGSLALVAAGGAINAVLVYLVTHWIVRKTAG